MTTQWMTWDALECLRTLPDESVNCVVTSPPYWGLRDYGVAGQIGLERTPEEYVARLVEVFREVRRVLRRDGTCWINMGDSYASAPAGNFGLGMTKPADGGSYRENKPKMDYGLCGLKPKDLCGIPWRVAFALQAGGWWLRQDIIWAKPNPMPESVRDRCTRSHEYVFLLTKSAKYWYCADAIAEQAVSKPGKGVIGRGTQGSALAVGCNGRNAQQDHSGWMGGDGETRNRRSVWTITPKPFAEAHFATFPPELPEICIKAGCPPDGTVLDPFAGAGTTGLVAQRLGRSFIGIELNADYIEMAKRRLERDVI